MTLSEYFSKRFYVLILLLMTFTGGFGQEVTSQNVVWYGHFLTLKLNNGWYIQNEIQERHFVAPFHQHQFLLRAHLHKQIGKKGMETSMGLCYFLQSANEPETMPKLAVPELRPHFEFAFRQNVNRIQFDHRLRSEARFFHLTNESRTELEEGFVFSHFRIRYKLSLSVPLKKWNDTITLKWKISDEMHVNVSKSSPVNFFDQNRIYTGLVLELINDLKFELGYMNWFQQRPNMDFYNRHILRFTFYNTIRLGQK